MVLLSLSVAVDASQESSYDIHGIDAALFRSLDIDTDHSIETVAQQLVYSLEQQGYFLAVVAVHDQVIHVHLGSISHISISGLGARAEARARSYLEAVNKNAPKLTDVDTALALINDMPGIAATIAFELDKSDGSYHAFVSATESAQAGSLALDSTPRNLFNQNRVSLQQVFYSALTGGDSVRAQASYVTGDDKPDQSSLYLDYQSPLGSAGVYYEVSLADVESQTSVTGPSTISYVTNTGFILIPGTTTRQDFSAQMGSFTIGYPLAHRHNGATYILGSIDASDEKISGVGDTETWFAEISVLQTAYSPDGWSYVWSVELGSGNSDSYIDDYDGEFNYLKLHGGYIKPLPQLDPRTELRVEGFAQISSEYTPTSQLMAIGEEDFLRGYETATFVGSDGAVGTLELAHAYNLQGFIQQITAFAFLDAGYVDNPKKWESDRRPTDDSLWSYGFGANTYFKNNIAFYGYVGAPMSDDYRGKKPGPRAYLRLTWSW